MESEGGRRKDGGATNEAQKIKFVGCGRRTSVVTYTPAVARQKPDLYAQSNEGKAAVAAAIVADAISPKNGGAGNSGDREKLQEHAVEIIRIQKQFTTSHQLETAMMLTLSVT